MNFEFGIKDLIILAADSNIKSAIGGILSRQHSLNIRRLNSDIFTHLHRDSGCLRESHLFLINFINTYRYAIVIFDREGCGEDYRSRDELETTVENNLSEIGWGGRSIALVLDPELEVWVWKDSPHVETALGWSGINPPLRTWLFNSGFITEGDITPRRPKEALEAALRQVHRPRSSAIYKQLAETVGFKNCNNPTFLKLSRTLEVWFPVI